MWLGAAAALSGAGTLAYLLVRSSQRGRGNGMPSKTSESHSTKGSENSHDASIRQDGSCERLNGHLPSEGQADSVSEVPSAAECHKEAKQQNLSERSLTSGEMCDVNAGVERLSSDLDENLSELVSAIQDKIVKSDNLSNTSSCEEVSVQPQADDKEISQPITVEGIVADLAHTHNKHQQDASPGPEKDRETRECIGTYAIEEKKEVASSEKKIPINASYQETVCSDTDSSSLEGTACVSNLTESSLSLPEPVVEELSQCRILKPQCDPCCCEDHSETCHHTPTPVSSEFTEFSNEKYATLNAQEATQKSALSENPGIPPERHYTLTLKSNEENFCISGKHIHDPSPTEAPVTETNIEGQEGGAELNKDEPGTCIVTIEQREKVDEKQVPPSPLASPQEECLMKNESVYYECSAAAGKDCCGESESKKRTTSGDTEGTVLEVDDKMMQPIGNDALETPTPVQEKGSIEEDATQDQGQSDIKQEVPQEQKRIASEQENNDEQQHNENMNSAPEKEPQSSSNEKEVPPEQKMNASEAEEKNERQEYSTSEQLAPKEEEQSSCSEQHVPQEQKQDHDEERRRAEKQEQSENQLSSIIQEETLKQEQNDKKQEATTKQQQSISKQETRPSGKKQLEVTQKQEKESNNKQHKAQVEQEQTKSNKQVAATTQEQVEKEGTQKQKEDDKKQKLAKEEELPHPREEMKEGDKKQKLAKEEEQPHPREETKKGNKKQKLTKEEEQAGPREEMKEGNKKQKLVKEEEQASPREEIKEGDKKQKLTKEEEQSAPREETQEQREGNKKEKLMQKEEQPRQREGTQKQKEANKEQKITQKEAKSNHTQDTGIEKKEESDNKQQVTQTEEQMNHEKEITSPEQSAKDQVTGDQTAFSPSKLNNNNSSGKKGSVRSRGDSASADLDCDVGSEQDNLNCDSSSLVSRYIHNAPGGTALRLEIRCRYHVPPDIIARILKCFTTSVCLFENLYVVRF